MVLLIKIFYWATFACALIFMVAHDYFGWHPTEDDIAWAAFLALAMGAFANVRQL